MPPSLFELRRAREEKAAPQRSDGGTKEERDDRPMLAIAERRARPKAKRFDRPYGTGVSFTTFPSTSYWATFTESLPPCPAVVRIEKATSRLRRTGRDKSATCNPKLLKLTLMGAAP
jgi:hypothetical protein